MNVVRSPRKWRVRDLWAEDRIKQELRLRNRTREEGMVYQTPAEGLEAERSVVDVELAEAKEQLPQYKPRREISERESLNEEIRDRRRNEELAASNEEKMPIDGQPRPYDEIMIADSPPAYVKPRRKILQMNNE